MSVEINSEFGWIFFLFAFNLKQIKPKKELKTHPFRMIAWRVGDKKSEILRFFRISFKETIILGQWKGLDFLW